MKTLLTGAVLALAVLAACGGGSSDEDKIRRVVNDFVTGYNRGDADHLYDLVDSASKASCSKSAFTANLKEARDDSANAKFAVTSVRDITVDGDAAKATIVSSLGGETGEPADETFVKEDGKWKLVGSFC